MANMIDYLKWRGDITLEQSPFNEVDNIILANLSYVDLDGILPGVEEEDAVTLAEASRAYFQKRTVEDVKKDKNFTRLSPILMKEMANSQRFQNAKLGKYVNQVSIEKEEQFSAMQIELGDESIYIAYRGTDDTIIGWKEDFNMSTGIVPAQLKSVDYLEKVLAPYTNERMIRLGGHSKGGNLAIYAATQCSVETAEKVREIYNNDGPGFSKEIMNTEGFHIGLPKVRSYIPEFSVIGMLLEHKSVPVIVSSSQKGVMQHDAMSWMVEGREFLHQEKIEKGAQILDQALKNWLYGLDNEKKSLFIEDFFSVLEAPGVQTLTELQDGGIKNAAIMLKKAGTLNGETRDIILCLVKNIMQGLV